MQGLSKTFHLLVALLSLYLEPSKCVEDVSAHQNLALLPTDICGPVDPDVRIFGGVKASLIELPWMAMVIKKRKGNKSGLICGGSLINDRYILTAAHCVGRTFPNLVRLGDTLNIDAKVRYPPGKTQSVTRRPAIEVEKVIPHPNYTTEPHPLNDIALLRLSTSVEFRSGAVLPICLPIGIFGDDEHLIGRFASIAGWGMTNSGKSSFDLLQTSVPIKEISDCTGNLSAEAHMCAGGDEDGGDSCRGDSGSPLTLEESVKGELKAVQIGISSYGDIFCGTPGYPAVYTNVGHYLKWILDNIEP